MREEVRRAWFRYHYVEMRGEHRAADNPIERGDSVAVLQAMTQTLSHALRAAVVLDGQPYPYIKWLAHAAFQTPTGKRLAPRVAELLDCLACDALRLPGPEKTTSHQPEAARDPAAPRGGRACRRHRRAVARRMVVPTSRRVRASARWSGDCAAR